jgi:hypothetical protein
VLRPKVASKDNSILVSKVLITLHALHACALCLMCLIMSKCSRKHQAASHAIQESASLFRASFKALQQEQTAERVMLQHGVPCFFRRIIVEPQCDLLANGSDHAVATATFSSHQVSTVGAQCAP